MDNLVFLHGWVNKYIIDKDKNIIDFYKNLIIELNKYFNVYFITLPGFSNILEPSKPFTLDDYVEYVRKYLEEKGINNFYLMGHSFGGQIAAKFSYYYPEKIKKLIIYNGACIRRKTIKQKILQIFKPISKLILKVSPFMVKKIFYKVVTGSTSYLKLSPIMKETMKNVISEDLTSILPSIKTDTILIWGEKDKITLLKDAYIIHQLINGSKLIIYKEGDHNFHLKNTSFIVENLKNL
ncbi:MAG: hydrolase [Candidatus Parcubacteria bacterium]|nr:MAG: hydrolase [Candidatus Parcubacteria bacterium]